MLADGSWSGWNTYNTYSGASLTWQTYNYLYGGISGRQIQIAFLFTANNIGNLQEGIYLDNIRFEVW
jgi:hypothetical protein